MGGKFIGVALAGVVAVSAGCKHESTEAKAPVAPPSGAGPATPAAANEPRLSPDDRTKPLAKLEGTVITLGDFEDRLMSTSPYVRHRYATREKKKEFLDNMIRFELMAKEAMAKGYDKDPEVLRTMKQVMIQKLIRNDFESKLKPEDIPEPELRAYYEKNQKEFNTPEQVRASHILIKLPPNPTAAQKSAGRDRAKTVLDELKQKGSTPEVFAELAKKYSEDPGSKMMGGDLRYFARTEQGGAMVKEFSDAAFALQKPGDLSDVVESKFGYHIVRLTDRRAAQGRTLDQVKRQIQSRLYREKRTKMFDEWVKSLREKTKVAVTDDLLDLIKVSATPPAQAMRPGMPGMPGMGGHGGMVPGRPGMPGMPGMPGRPRVQVGGPSSSPAPMPR